MQVIRKGFAEVNFKQNFERQDLMKQQQAILV